MIRKSLPYLGSSILIFLVAACSGAAQSNDATASRPSGIWPLLLFFVLAIFFWGWLRQSDNQPEALSEHFKMRTQEGAANKAPSAKPAPTQDYKTAATGTVSSHVVSEPATQTVLVATPVAEAAMTSAPVKDIVVEDPVRVERLTDKQKKAQKKGPAGEDDYTIVEGIGPKINGVLHGAGLITYSDLANTAVDKLRQILAANSLQLHDPGTWSEQSGLAAEGKWSELEKLQSTLSGGKRK